MVAVLVLARLISSYCDYRAGRRLETSRALLGRLGCQLANARRNLVSCLERVDGGGSGALRRRLLDLVDDTDVLRCELEASPAGWRTSLIDEARPVDGRSMRELLAVDARLYGLLQGVEGRTRAAMDPPGEADVPGRLRSCDEVGRDLDSIRAGLRERSRILGRAGLA